MHHLSSVNQPLYASSIFVAHHQEVYCIYTKNSMFCVFQLTSCWPANTYQLLCVCVCVYIYVYMCVFVCVCIYTQHTS